MKINKSYVIAGLAFLVIVIWFLLHSGDEAQSETGSILTQKETPTPSVVVEYRSAQEHPNIISLYGRTEAAREVSIKAQTAGTIVATPAREGAKIKRGALLCRQDIDARQAQLDQAKATYRAAEVDLNAARVLAEKGFQSATRVTAIEAQIDAASAAIKQAEIELDNINIRAPFAGIWERQMAETGDYLSPGQACGLLVELSPLVVTAELTETQLGSIELGQSADIILATGQTVSGTLRMIEARANPNTRTFRAEIEVPNEDYAIKAGVTADIRLSAGVIKAQHIPSKILALNDTGSVGVRYLNADNTVGFAQVTTVDEDRDGIWVTGLPDETRVIVKGQDYVAIGSTVEPSVAGQN